MINPTAHDIGKKVLLLETREEGILEAINTAPPDLKSNARESYMRRLMGNAYVSHWVDVKFPHQTICVPKVDLDWVE